MKRFVAVLLFSASLCAPVMSLAEEHHRFFDSADGHAGNLFPFGHRRRHSHDRSEPWL